MPDAKTTLFPVAQDLSGLNTLGLASRAGACVTLDQPSQLPALSALARERAPLLVLGGGSNVVLPETVPGLVARVRFQGVRLLRRAPMPGWSRRRAARTGMASCRPASSRAGTGWKTWR